MVILLNCFIVLLLLAAICKKPTTLLLMTKKNILLFLFMFLTLNLYSQRKTYNKSVPSSFGLIVGHQGFSSNLFETGLAYDIGGKLLFSGLNAKVLHKILRPHLLFYGSYQFDPFKKINGTTFGISLSGLVVYGIDFNYYYKENYFWGFRPSIGIGIWGLEILYRYNFKLAGDKKMGVSGHLFSLRYYLPILVKSDGKFKFGSK